VVLDSGDHPAAQPDQQDQGDDPEAELVAARRSGGLVNPEQPAEQALGTSSQRKQRSHRARAD